MELPLVYAIILNYNGYYESIECIKSLLKITYPNLRILIVDNKSTDESFKRLQNEFPTLEYVASEFNGGYAAGMNLGARYALKAMADYILLLNQDTEVSPSFLEPMLHIFKSNKETGIVSPKVGYTDKRNTIYCAGGNINRYMCGGIASYQGKEFEKYALSDRIITLAEGCCILIKSEVYKNIGFMNEKFFMYFEDIEFSQRVMSKYNIYFCSSAVIYHKSGAGKSWSEFGATYNYYYTRNRLLFFNNEHIIYRIYVLFFSSLNVIMKSFFTFKNKTSLKALWKGYLDGLLLHFNLKKI